MHRKICVSVALMILISACSNGETVETTSPAITDDITTSETATTTTPTTTVEPTTTEVPEETTTTTTAPPPEPEFMAIDIVFEDGSVAGETRITVPLGEDVVVTVESDVVDHVHLHGYDIFADVAPGSPGTIEFTADIPGIFEVELEDSGVRLVELEVTP